MGQYKHGVVSLRYPDTFTVPPEAGTLSPEAARRTPKARRGIGLACQMTAEAMQKHSERLSVKGVVPSELAAAGAAAEEIDGVIADIEAALTYFKQGNLLLDAHAHTELRKVLAYVRAQEKFDPKLAELVPHLVAYFANAPTEPSEPTEPAPPK